jgi:hypothetical protein
MFFYLVPLLLLLSSCGDDGNNDTVLTGFSGVIILGLVAWIVVHFLRKGDK